jgi:hypothetical protein
LSTRGDALDDQGGKPFGGAIDRGRQTRRSRSNESRCILISVRPKTAIDSLPKIVGAQPHLPADFRRRIKAGFFANR